jgi:hypothetical protein
MTMAPYHAKLDRVLDRMGGLYTVADILDAIAAGTMQSFVVNNSWAITQINVYPRTRLLYVIAVVGDLADLEDLNAQVQAFADRLNIPLIATHGRAGLVSHGRRLGWRLKTKSYLFHKEM